MRPPSKKDSRDSVVDTTGGDGDGDADFLRKGKPITVIAHHHRGDCPPSRFVSHSIREEEGDT